MKSRVIPKARRQLATSQSLDLMASRCGEKNWANSSVHKAVRAPATHGQDITAATA